VCGGKNSYFNDLDPHEDWEARVKSATWKDPSTPEAKVAQNRLLRFREAGLDLATAMVYAADHTVDLHEFERLRKQGCEPATAARIVAPLRA
jgi:hypothetical protein